MIMATDRATILSELFKNPVEKEMDNVIVERIKDQSDEALLARIERRIDTLQKEAAAASQTLSYEDASVKAWEVEMTNRKNIAKLRDLRR